MATTKETETKEVKKEVKVVDPWKQMVAIKLPKAINGEPNYKIASVNGRVFKIQRGVVVEVPAPIAEVLDHSDKEAEIADAFIEQNGH